MQSNFALLNFESEDYSIYRIKYEDEKQLDGLRDSHNKTNSFFRDGNYIYHSPMKREGSFYEGELINLSVSDDIDITKKLLHHLVFRTIFRTDSIMADFYPIKFFTRNRENDLIKDVINDKSQSTKVGYWKGFKIDSRIIKYNNQPFYGLVLNVLYSWKIKVNCKSALEMGISLEEKYVEIYDTSRSEIFKSNRNLVGKVVSHDGETAIIEKEEVEEKYSLTELYFENSFQNRQDILENFLGHKKASSNFSHLKNTVQQRAGAQGKEKSIKSLHDWLSQLIFSNNHGFSFTISDFIQSYDHLWEKMQINKPVFIFNFTHNQTDTWHDRGLREYGPYSRTNFTPSKPKIAVIFREGKRGQVSRFMAKFRDGIPAIKTKGYNPYQPYGQGFASKYRLSGIEIKPFQVKDETISSYEKTIRLLIEEMGESVDLVVIESCEAYKKLAPANNPYFFAKAQLIKHGIPSQVVLYENMILPDKQLAYILNNSSLAVYAKIGGTPWVTPSDPNVEHELVIGIGNKVFKDDRFGISRRIVGIATLFSGEGKYLLSNTSKDVPYEEYLEELKQSLIVNIKKIRKQNNWMRGDTVRLVFHVFKPFNEEEILAIESMVDELKTDFEIIFAYITIARHHPFLIFDKRQNGVPDYKNYGHTKGIWQPEKTTNMKIDDHQWLLQLIGPNEIKSYRQGMTAPILVKLHERSSFKDIEYLTKQVYTFSCISWRGFLPTSLPVTLEYANQIAHVLGNFRASGYWNNDLLPNKLNSKAWFL